MSLQSHSIGKNKLIPKENFIVELTMKLGIFAVQRCLIINNINIIPFINLYHCDIYFVSPFVGNKIIFAFG